MKRRTLAFILCVAILAPAALLARSKDIIDREIVAAWKGIQTPEGMWSYAISPPLPKAWPAKQTELLYYAYAMSMVPADATRVSAPWARVTVQGDGTRRLEVLTPKLQVIGTQGVKPVGDISIAGLFKRAEILEGVMLALASGAAVSDRNVSEMKRYYCAWSSFNGVIAAKLRPLHPAFFQWLACEMPKGQ